MECFELTAPRLQWIAAGILIAQFLSALEVTAVPTAMPAALEDLGGLGGYPWLFAIYVLGMAISRPLWKRRAGQRALLLALLLFVGGSALCGKSQSMGALVVWRLVTSIGAGGIVTAGGELLKRIAADGARASSHARGVMLAGAIFGTLFGAAIAVFSWRMVFFINLPLGLSAFVILLAFLPKLQVSAGALPAQRTGCAPKSIMRYALLVLPTCMALLGAICYTPLYIQDGLRYSPFHIAFALAPLTMGWLCLSSQATHLVARKGRCFTARIGALAFIAGYALLALVQSSLMVWLATAGLLIGLGGALTWASVLRETQSETDGLLYAAHLVAGAVGIVLMGLVATATRETANLSEIALKLALHRTFILGACVPALLIVSAHLLAEGTRGPAEKNCIQGSLP